MYLLGHVGITLFVYAPVSYLLIRAEQHRRAGGGALTLLLLVCAPDVDSRIPFLTHRGITHTVWAALVVGVAVALVWWGFAPDDGANRIGATAFGFLVGALSVTNHLLGDVLTPMGIRPFYPVVDTEFTLDIVLSSNPTANLSLLTVGLFASLVALLLGNQSTADPGLPAGTPSPSEPSTVTATEEIAVQPLTDGGEQQVDG